MTTAKQLRAAGVFVPAHVPDHEQVEAIHFSKVGTVKPFEEMEQLLNQQGRQLNTLAEIILPLVTRKISRTAQAKKAGVSRSTLWRREKRARTQLLFSAAKPVRARRVV